MKLTLTIFLFLSVLNLHAQDISSQLVNKTFSRTFYALIFEHKAQYTFKNNYVVYKVSGFFVNDEYKIQGQYFAGGFIGKNPLTDDQFVLHIKIISNTKISILKEGIDGRYSKILSDKPVGEWYEYVLEKD